jgi:DUF1680 family protein
MKINPGKLKKFTLMVRIPGWADNQAFPTDLYRFRSVDKSKAMIRLNGSKVAYQLKNGYAVLSREWKESDQLVLELPMPVRELTANQLIKEDVGKVAIQRGPLVYCAEWPDNKAIKILDFQLSGQNKYTTKHLPELLNGVTIIQTSTINSKPSGDKIADNNRQILTAIPYYSWANRGSGEMSVWLNVAKQ